MTALLEFLFDRTWLLGLTVVVVTVGVLRLLRNRRVGRLFVRFIPDWHKRRLFLAAVSFLVTFGVARSLAYANYHHFGPFHDIVIRGRHIHHLVFGIALLLAVGYAALLGIGSGSTSERERPGRLIALLFGAGAALTLDEFALWLNLEDVYWSPEGRASIDAVMLFGALFVIGIWGRQFFGAIGRELLRLLKRGRGGVRAPTGRNGGLGD
jgi:hypothetical protein